MTKNENNENSPNIEKIKLPEILPVLGTKDLVPFPSVIMSIVVEGETVVNIINDSKDNYESFILLAAVKDDAVNYLDPNSYFKVGVVCRIGKVQKIGEHKCKVMLQGMIRSEISDLTPKNDYLISKAKPIPNIVNEQEDPKEAQEIIEKVVNCVFDLVQLEELPEDLISLVENIDDPGVLADVIIAHYALETHIAQGILEEFDSLERLILVNKLIQDDINHFAVSKNILNKTQEEMSKTQKDYYLREQLKQIKKELGEFDTKENELDDLQEALAKAKIPESSSKEVDKQFSRLQRMHSESSEYAILRTYLETVADLPWSTKTKDKLDVKSASKILDADHYGLEKVKTRILEFLSVRKLKKDSVGPILCLMGPPGVGKTSLGKSVAACLNRKFFSIALGGVRDEAEIRGHRRTYVGALPGKIIQAYKEVGSVNPVILLDEIDKVGADFRGDPASALLEILDPSQNCNFRDHYLNLPFDLSNTLFIVTANTLDTIPAALLDRLEVLRLSGYTVNEKFHIAKKYLVPRQIKQNGINDLKVKFDDKAIKVIIEGYTREAGVRNLEREISSVCRKLARDYVELGKKHKKVTPDLVINLLGSIRFESEIENLENEVGKVNGLAWTSVGGEVLPVETSIAKGTGKLILTGQLGDVMKESAQAALFYIRSNAEKLEVSPDFYSKYDIHIHLPNGATPKDGPSAGIAISTAIVSTLRNLEVSKDIAMTGEISLRGMVLPIGGLKEKALAALRHGIKTVIIPFANLKDIKEIPKEQRSKINFVPVKKVSEVIELALLKKKKITAKRKNISVKVKTKTKTKAKVKLKPKVKTKTKTKAKAKVKTKAKTKVKSKSKTKVKVKTQTRKRKAIRK